MKLKQCASKLGILLIFVLLVGLLTVTAVAEEPAGKFVLAVESGGKLVIAPEYISYTENQTLGEALMNSSHTFTGIEQGQVTAIDDVYGNYTRSDQNGGYDLSVQASAVTHFTFSERSSANSKPSEGLLLLMTAMADYQEKPDDVKNAAKEQYRAAKQKFVGCEDQNARTLAYELNNAVSSYEAAMNGTRHAVKFTDGEKVYSESNYPGVTITAENDYGKSWSDDNQDGTLELPVGTYHFCLAQNGLQVEGTIAVSAAAEISAVLPDDPWLTVFRLSSSYGDETQKDHRFIDGEFNVDPLDQWVNRETTIPVKDLFRGDLYVYAECREDLPSLPELKAIYTMVSTDKTMEVELYFESFVSGTYEVLERGADGNTVIYRVSLPGAGGFVYSQDYVVNLSRIPTLTAISMTNEAGTDQAPTERFSGDKNAYTYKVLDTTQKVIISGTPLMEDYTVLVNGSDDPVVVLDPSGTTTAEVTVESGGASNTYTLTIQTGAGKVQSFRAKNDVAIEVVNSNGVVIPFTTHKVDDTTNYYNYVLVEGENYHYVATKDTFYHIEDDFKLNTNQIITVDFANMGDWLTDISLGIGSGNKNKNTIKLTEAFDPACHRYQAYYMDTEYVPYLWASTNETNITSSKVLYTQVSGVDLYHGKERSLDLRPNTTSGGLEIGFFLMDENPIENTLTIRLTKIINGVTHYQDYQVEFKRDLTLKEISAACDGTSTPLLQENGTNKFRPSVKTYNVTVSMSARKLELSMLRYQDNRCFGEKDVGYRIFVDGQEVSDAGRAEVSLDGTLNTQVVTIEVKNDKAPDGTGVYKLNVLKSPPVDVKFVLNPETALLNMYEVLSGERIWPDGDGVFQLCEGYSYDYALTEYGYVGQSGTLHVTRNEDKKLIVRNYFDESEAYEDDVVQETETGGAVTITWNLVKVSDDNSSIPSDMDAPWPNFRGSASNNATTDAPIPTAAGDGTLFWANQLGSGFDSDAVGSPIIVGDDLITYAGNSIFRIDRISGEILATGTMSHKSSFSITPPSYSKGMIFVALSNGCVQAFNAATLESLWIYKDPLGGQPNCPLAIDEENGYLYTGFWNHESTDANFVCLSITDEDPSRTDEKKSASWKMTAKGGYYWAGAYVGNGYVLIGTDDGTNLCDSPTSSLMLIDAKTGKLLDRLENLDGDIRSTIVYDSGTDAFYFTSKGGSFYCVTVSGGNKLKKMWSCDLDNGVAESTPMSTSSPVIYKGRAYIGVSGSSQFGAYSGHNITVLDLGSGSIAYRVNTQGYPQTSGLLCTAYEEQSGYVYVYFFDNMTPGKLRVLRDRPGQTQPDYLTKEMTVEGYEFTTAYALFTPTGDHAQYAICSPIADEYGTVYFKNDSAYLMAFGSALEKLEVENARTNYVVGDTFDPTGMKVTAIYKKRQDQRCDQVCYLLGRAVCGDG